MKKRLITYIIPVLLIASSNVCSQVQLMETVWLQTERELFLAGEEIYFRAELLENDTYKPSVLSNSLRLELIDSQGKNIKRFNLALEESEVTGKIEIPQNLSTGWYFLCAYTNWMRNFDEKYFTSRAIRIINPDDVNVQPAAERNKLELEITPYADPVSGRQMCSVHATDTYGTGIEAHGFILSGPRDTVLCFKTDPTGWASSYYNAAHPDRYQAFAENFPKENIRFIIQDKKISQGDAEISLTEKYGYLNVNIRNSKDDAEYKVLVHRFYSWSWFDRGKPDNGQLTFRIPLKDFPGGISQVAVLDEANNEIFRSLWSDYSELPASIRIEAGGSNFKIGSEQSFDFISPVISGRDASNRFKLIVHADVPGSDIYSYLPGLPGWPALSGIPAGDEAFRAWLNSNTYAPGTAAAFFRDDPEFPSAPSFNTKGDRGITYYPDTRTGSIRGWIRDKQGMPLPLKNVAMTILNDNLFSAARTDEQGFFALTFPGLHGSKDYFLNYYNEYDPSWKLEQEETFTGLSNLPEKGRASFTAEEGEFLKNQGLLLQLKDIYYATDSAEIVMVDDSRLLTHAFYGKPDYSIDVDEYIKLPNLREVFLEVVPFVAVRQRDGRSVLLSTGNNLLAGDFPALVLLDGIPLYEYDDLLNLPPDRIVRIEGINDFYVHGNVVLSGIVNIISRNSDFAGLKIPRSAVISNVQLPVKPDADDFTGNLTIKGYPQIDNIVIWDKFNPSSGNSVTIKMNDYPGRHAVSVYGFDTEGRWYRGVNHFNVN
ncbi:MAG TPA: hypothetical protein ENH59_00480 [Bacteroidetes bacterium]|nr:hypothetical protein [Bacteroidota bacterium]